MWPSPRVPSVPTTAPGPAGRQIRAQAAYEAGTSPANRRAAGWGVTDHGPIATTQQAATIRARARHAARNDALAAACVSAWVDDAAGWGPVPKPRAKDRALRDRLSRDWAEWSERCADTGSDFGALVAAVVGALIVDGEALVRLRPRRPTDGLVVPLALELVEAARLPHDLTHDLPNGGRVVQGVELSPLGRPVAYHLLDAAPGEPMPAGSSGTPRRIEAESMLHIFDRQAPGMVRGVSKLAPSLVRLRGLDAWQDALLLRQQISNLFVGFVRKPAGMGSESINALTGAVESSDAAGRQLAGLEPGLFSELASGEDVTFSDPPAPPSSDSFALEQARLACLGTGVPLEIATHNWGASASNDRLARATLASWRRHVDRFRWTVLVPGLLRPVWSAFCAASGYQPTDDDPGWTRADWSFQRFPALHPLQDVRATVEAVRSGLLPLSGAIAEAYGEDAESVLEQVAADFATCDRLGLRLDSDPRDGKGGAR
jgi:lambda family phage portal protein